MKYQEVEAMLDSLPYIEDNGYYMINENTRRTANKYCHLANIIAKLAAIDIEEHHVYPLVTNDVKDMLTRYFMITGNKEGYNLRIPLEFCEYADILSAWSQCMGDVKLKDTVHAYKYDVFKMYALEYLNYLKDANSKISYDFGKKLPSTQDIIDRNRKTLEMLLGY